MKYLIYIIIIASVYSCKKAEDRSCFKTAGQPIEKTFALESFDRLHLGPHIEYVLVQDSTEKLVISGGKKLVNLIEASVSEQLLTIENKNRCNFLRSYKKSEIKVEIHFKDIINVLFEGTKKLTCKNKLNLKKFVFVIKDGAGHVSLNLDAVSLHTIITNGWGNFDLNGRVNYLNLEIHSNGFGDAYNLNVLDSMDIISKTQEEIKINADQCLLKAETKGDGDIWYIGLPDSIQFNAYGAGRLLNKN